MINSPVVLSLLPHRLLRSDACRPCYEADRLVGHCASMCIITPLRWTYGRRLHVQTHIDTGGIGY